MLSTWIIAGAAVVGVVVVAATAWYAMTVRVEPVEGNTVEEEGEEGLESEEETLLSPRPAAHTARSSLSSRTMRSGAPATPRALLLTPRRADSAVRGAAIEAEAPESKGEGEEEEGEQDEDGYSPRAEAGLVYTPGGRRVTVDLPLGSPPSTWLVTRTPTPYTFLRPVRPLTDALSGDAIAALFLLLSLHALAAYMAVVGALAPDVLPSLLNSRGWAVLRAVLAPYFPVAQPVLLLATGAGLARITAGLSPEARPTPSPAPSEARFTPRPAREEPEQEELIAEGRPAAVAEAASASLSAVVRKGLASTPVPPRSPLGADDPTQPRTGVRVGGRATAPAGVATPDPVGPSGAGYSPASAPHSAAAALSCSDLASACSRLLAAVDADLGGVAGNTRFSIADTLACSGLHALGCILARVHGFDGRCGDVGSGPRPKEAAALAVFDVSAPPEPSPTLPSAAEARSRLLQSSSNWSPSELLRLTAALPRAPDLPIYAVPCSCGSRGQDGCKASMRADVTAALLWRRGGAALLRGVSLLKGGSSGAVVDDVAIACTAACGGRAGAAALTVFRRGLACTRASLSLAEECPEAHKYAGVLLGRTDGGDIAARLSGAHAIRSHFQRGIALRDTDPILHHALGVWCFEVSGLSWSSRQLAAAFFGTPPTSTYSEAIVHLTASEEISSSGRGVDVAGKPVEPFLSNRLKLAQSYLADGKKDEAREWLSKALELTPGAAEDETVPRQIKELARRLGMAVPPSWGA
jgi:hypothetical protein